MHTPQFQFFKIPQSKNIIHDIQLLNITYLGSLEKC